ncbi:MAG: YMGG-like glycine zipper-containing protein [Acidithiobacillus sp.]
MNAKIFSLRSLAYAGVLSLGLAGLSGCAHMSPTQQRALSGGAIGAAGGAALGAVTGGSPAVGAAVGGVAGGAAGALMSNH